MQSVQIQSRLCLSIQEDLTLLLSTFRLGNSPIVSRIYSYGILRLTEIDVNAIVALFRYNKWTRTAILYNPYFLADYTSYKLFTEMLTLLFMATIAFYSSVTADNIPLMEVRQNCGKRVTCFSNILDSDVNIAQLKSALNHTCIPFRCR